MFQLNSVGQRNFDVSIACPAISGVALALRIYCKIRFKSGLHGDDFWMVLTVIAAWAAGAVEIWGNITGGHGREVMQILRDALKHKNMKMLENYLLGLYTAWMLYLLAAYAVKVCVLLFYRRIFVTITYQRISLALIVASTIWFIVSEAVGFAVCIPLDAFWNRQTPGKCMNSNTYLFIAGIFDALLDLAIVALPIRMVFTLHLPTRTKIALAGIFALGGLVVITNFLRVKFMYQPNAFYANYNEALFWSSIHMMTAHICACLPIYKPLWQSLSSVVGRYTSRLTSRSSSKPSKLASRASTDTGVPCEQKGSSVVCTVMSSSSGPTLVPPVEDNGLLCVKIEGGTLDVDEDNWPIPDGRIGYERHVHVV